MKFFKTPIWKIKLCEELTLKNKNNIYDALEWWNPVAQEPATSTDLKSAGIYESKITVKFWITIIERIIKNIYW